ncbi:MAG TPA: Wzz/FepE/Etk N-terminal domain-containing protein [Prolixibacteraceae bacterium]|nr:Wzz/FepE/Etk N-terminal domain-containing protein [Prolixibacteraceae bacterium]
MTPDSTKSPKPTQETEVDFINLARTFWDGRIIIGKLILFGILVGFFVAILIPNEFTASSTMVPQISDPKSKLGGLSAMSGLSGLAAMAGVNLSTATGSELSPKTYSSIISSVPFQLELMKTPLNFEKLDSQITLYDYYTKIRRVNSFVKYTIGLPSLIIKMIKGEKKNRFSSPSANPLYQLTEKQIEVQKIIEKKVGIFVNDGDGYVTLNCSLPEDYAAAQLVQNAQLLLQRYITEFKIEKAKLDEEFIQQRYDEAKKNYQAAQKQLASFRDRNKNVSLATARTEEEGLYGEYTLVTGVYSELAKKLEQAKIQVKEETPVFTIIKPVSVPPEKSRPNRPMILAISAFIGFIIGTVWVLGKDFMVQTRNKWRGQDHKMNIQ